MKPGARKFLDMFLMLVSAGLGLILVSTLAFALFPIAVSLDVAGMRLWLDARQAPLALLRMAMYAAVAWYFPVWMRVPESMHRNVRVNIAAGVLVLEAVCVQKLWQYF